MSEFFEPPPPSDAPALPKRHRSPPWVHAPEGTLPGAVAVGLVLARTATIAVCVTRINAYPTGFELELVTMSDDEDGGVNPLLFERSYRRAAMPLPQGQGIPDEMLRFGVEFSNGAKATNIPRGLSNPRTEPPGPVMRPGGGGGNAGSWRQTLWVWPLPPTGPLAFVCEWPAANIPLSRHNIDAQLILDAATKAQVIFATDHPTGPPAPPVA